MDPIKEALTFDDVTLAPKYSSVLPSEVNTSVKLSKNLNLKIPLLSSAMDTVTESKMAIEIARAGGIGVIHRNLSISDQILEIKKVQKKGLAVGAAVGTNNTELSRAEKIIKCKVDLIVVDTPNMFFYIRELNCQGCRKINTIILKRSIRKGHIWVIWFSSQKERASLMWESW